VLHPAGATGPGTTATADSNCRWASMTAVPWSGPARSASHGRWLGTATG